MKTAIITGASSGLGKEYFYCVLKMFPSIENIWLIARRETILQELKNKFTNVNIRILTLDLTQNGDLEKLKAALEQEKPDVKLLINNAGIGKLGCIIDSDPESQTAMIDLNCRALSYVTSVVLPYMSCHSNIVNVASIAAFAPTPRMTVYSATKAFIYAYSNGLRFELKNRDINVTAVCPGPMATEFLSRADIVGNSKAFQMLPYSSPYETAKKSLIAARRGHAVYTSRAIYKVYRVLSNMLPNEILMHATKV